MATEGKQAAKFGAMGFAILALTCAAFAAFVLSRMIVARGLDQEKKLPVVVTTRAISAGEPVTREALRVAVFVESNVPLGAIQDIEALFKDGKTKVAATGITAGEPLIASRLADAALGTAMAVRITSGYRGVAVKVDNSVARAGLLYPGARVDVVGTIRNSRSFVTSSRVTIENVRVLSVESRLDVETYKPAGTENNGPGSQKSESDTVVTIEVTPEQAELVVLAEHEGKLDLMLRNATDSTPVATPGATPARIVSSPAMAAAQEGNPEEKRPRVAARRRSGGGGAIETFHAK
jgi:pilus assembly protein CpaB